jgi:hypothetical protein
MSAKSVLNLSLEQAKAKPNKWDPQAPTKLEQPNNSFPALPLHRRASQTLPLSNIFIQTFFPRLPSTTLSTMAGPVRSSTSDNRLVQPPRPPNAWILYRSDKLRELPPTAPGIPRRAQAEVSKLISNMWKTESEDVRTQYERRADAKKAEHQAMYPGYRFQPMKKEEKDRLREEKRLEKERERAQSKRTRTRSTPYAAGYVPPTGSYPSQFYPQEMQYGPAGPSPPISAAASPTDTGPYHESLYAHDERTDSQSVDASSGIYPPPLNTNLPSSSSVPTSPLYPHAMPLQSQGSWPAQSPLASPHSPTGSGQWQPPYLASPQATAPPTNWISYNPPAPSQPPLSPQVGDTLLLPPSSVLSVSIPLLIIFG